MIPLLALLLSALAQQPASDTGGQPADTGGQPADTASPAPEAPPAGEPVDPNRHHDYPGPGSKPGTPSLQDPFPFDHQAHAKAFRQVKVACADCHPIGLTTRESGSYQWPGDEVPHPYTNCHACHRHEVEGSPRSARGLCLQCHADPDEIKPESHDLGWLDDHGLAARMPGNDCEDCHTDSRCIACHDDRGPLGDNPHGPGFYAYHGIEARMDPRKCSTCHETASCTHCHETGSLPW